MMRSFQRRKKRKKTVHRTQRDIVYSSDASRSLFDKKFYDKDSSGFFLTKTDGIVKVTIPKDFSIATDPDEVIYILKKIFYRGIDRRVREIVLAAKSYRRSSCKADGLVISGNYPTDQYTKDVFIGSGLVKHLNLHARGYRQENESKIFKLVSGKVGSQESATVATKLTKYFRFFEDVTRQIIDVTQKDKQCDPMKQTIYLSNAIDRVKSDFSQKKRILIPTLDLFSSDLKKRVWSLFQENMDQVLDEIEKMIVGSGSSNMI